MRSTQPKARTLLLIFTLLQLAACKEEKQTEPKPPAEPTPPAPPSPVITAPAPVHDFGRVHLGSRMTHVFKIKNTGKGDLTINNAAGS